MEKWLITNIGLNILISACPIIIGLIPNLVYYKNIKYYIIINVLKYKKLNILSKPNFVTHDNI